MSRFALLLFTFSALLALAWLSATPVESAALLQIDACAPPQAQVRNSAVNVREGPDPNYRILVVVQDGETLPIIGRHHGFRWWAVSLPDGETGWVWESGVDVFGDIASVPLMPAPPLNGVVPDTTEAWTPVITTPCVAPESSGEDEGSEAPAAVLTPEPDDASALVRDGWSQPLNLSQSGGVGNPSLLVDENGSLHALWEDSYNGYTYTRLKGDVWAAPVTITIPFSDTQAHLFAGPDSQLQALWIDEEGALQHSRAEAATITDPSGWQPAVALADSATAMAATVDGEGLIHLAYLRAAETAENPSGIYYRRSEDGGANWSPAELLYASSYLRGISAAESNVQIAATTTGGETNVYVAWDNRPRKRLFLIHGRDGGAEWHSPVELAGPDSTSSIILPFNVRLSAEGSNVLVAWQYGQPGNQCQRRAQASTDSGQSWSEPRTLADLNPGFASCASDQQIYADGSLFYLLAASDNQIFLQAWDGSEWSEPQRQPAVSGFNEPETLNTVVLGCHQAALLDGPTMAMVACDAAGALTSGDIWFTFRSLGTAETWFPPPTAWDKPVVVAAGEASESTLQLLGDSGGAVHALWVAENPEQETNAIHYSGEDGDRWLPVTNLSSGFGAVNVPVGPLTAAMGPDDRLFVVWQNRDGSLVLSQAAAAEAGISSEWAPPTPLPATHSALSGIAMVIEADGTLDVAYSVPLNEGRGVYLLQSDDRGANWSEPVLVLDGQALEWEIVGAPQLAVSATGSLHFLVPEETLGRVSAVRAEALWFVHCEPSGDPCREPALVSENQPRWSSIVTAGPQTIHRVWWEQSGDELIIRHAYSADDGGSWSETQLVARVTATGAGPGAVAPDLAGGLHLFQLDVGALFPWVWGEDVWQQRQIVATGAEGPLQAVVTPNGTVAVLFSRAAEAGEEAVDTGPQRELVVMSRQIALDTPAPEAAPLPAATPVAEPVVRATDTPSPAPTPTIALAELPENGSEENGVEALVSANTPVAQIGAGVIPVALLVAVVLVLGARSVWLRRR